MTVGYLKRQSFIDYLKSELETTEDPEEIERLTAIIAREERSRGPVRGPLL